jgi:hypothetical protein
MHQQLILIIVIGFIIALVLVYLLWPSAPTQKLNWEMLFSIFGEDARCKIMSRDSYGATTFANIYSGNTSVLYTRQDGSSSLIESLDIWNPRFSHVLIKYVDGKFSEFIEPERMFQKGRFASQERTILQGLLTNARALCK